MSDPRELIREAGIACYGVRWQAALARVLGINIRTIRRWTSGEDTPRPRVWADIKGLAQHRRNQLTYLIAKLDHQAALEESTGTHERAEKAESTEGDERAETGESTKEEERAASPRGADR